VSFIAKNYFIFACLLGPLISSIFIIKMLLATPANQLLSKLFYYIYFVVIGYFKAIFFCLS